LNHYRVSRNKVNRLNKILHRLFFFKKKTQNSQNVENKKWCKLAKEITSFGNTDQESNLKMQPYKASDGDMETFTNKVNNFVQSITNHLIPLLQTKKLYGTSNIYPQKVIQCKKFLFIYRKIN
jgi:hypothetical protein